MISCGSPEQNQVTIRKDVERLLGHADSLADGHIRKLVIDSAYTLLLKSPNIAVTRDLLFDVAARYEQVQAQKSYKDACEAVFALAAQKSDTAHLARSTYWIGDYYNDRLQLDSAFLYYRRAENLYLILGDSVNYGRSILNQSSVLYDSGNFAEGVVQGIRALQVLKRTDKHYFIFDSYLKIALSLKELKDYSKAIEYFILSSAELAQLNTADFSEERISYLTALHYNNLGTVYERLDQNTKAIDYYNRGLQTRICTNNRPSSTRRF